MVNENKNIREEVLKALFQAEGETVSGMQLSSRFDISRTAIWKHINQLKTNGFTIESGAKGYVLLNPDDLLLPFCFSPRFQDRIYHFQELSSTMDQAKQSAKSAPHLSVVIAEHQLNGRGRLNREWVSSAGGLWFTLMLKPQTPPFSAYIYNFAASLSLAASLRILFELPVTVKWPNDLLLEGKKLCGLLSEMATKSDMVEYLNIGIGLNVNNHPGKSEPNAISIKDVLQRPVSRKTILETFLNDFQSRIESIDCHDIIQQWKQITSTIGTQVRIETLTDTFEGLAVDVNKSGALIIKDLDGKQQEIVYGDCFHN